MSDPAEGRRDPADHGRHRSAGNTAILGFVYGVPLLVRLGFTYLGMKRRAKKAGKLFRKELISAGIDPGAANVLTEDYLRTSHLFTEMMSSAGKHRMGTGGHGTPFHGPYKKV